LQGERQDALLLSIGHTVRGVPEHGSARRPAGLRLIGVPLVDESAVDAAMAALRRTGLELALDVSMTSAVERIGLLAGYRTTPFVLVFENGRLRETHGPSDE